MNKIMPSRPAPFQKSQTAELISRFFHNCRMMLLLPLCFVSAAMADNDKIRNPGSTITLEPVVVTGQRPAVNSLNTEELESDAIVSKRSAVSDTAKLLEDIPGISLYGAGGVSSIPVIHGLNDDRVKVEVNGMSITSACANL